MYFLAHSDDPQKKFPGVFDLEQSVIDTSPLAGNGADAETIRVMASKMSRTVESYQQWHKESVDPLDEYYKKYAPLPLYKSPLIGAEQIWPGSATSKRENLFLCPSPQILMASLSHLLFRDLIENPHVMGCNVLSEIGYAAEEYLVDVFPIFFPNAQSITRVPTGGSKSADFIIDTQEATFVIEAKKCLSGVDGKTIIRPSDLLSIWCRLLESYQQCSYTIKMDLTKQPAGKPIICLVLVNDMVFGEQAHFDLMVHHSDLEGSLGIEYIEVLSIDAFERIFQHGSRSQIVAEILEKWKVAKQKKVIDGFYSLKPKRRGASGVNLTHLGNAFDEVFPSLKQPF